MARVVHLSYSDSGGAGSAAFYFHKKMLDKGIDSVFCVENKHRDESRVYQAPKKSKLAKKWRKHKQKSIERIVEAKYLFYGFEDTQTKRIQNWLSSVICNDTEAIYIHWVSQFITLEDVKRLIKNSNINVYVTLMDMAHFTGGCHYSYGCDGYKNACRNCPATQSKTLKDRIHSTFLSKAASYREISASALSINRRVEAQVKLSGMPFSDCGLIKPPTDDNLFCYVETNRLHAEQPTVFIGAYNQTDHRKGFDVLRAAFLLLAERLSNESKRLTVLVPSGINIDLLAAPCFDFDMFQFAKTSAELAKLYHRSDLFVNTSLDDSGPLMITEALFCGRPVIASDVGIIEELLLFDDSLGMKFPVNDYEILAQKIYSVLYSKDSAIAPSPTIEKIAKSYYKNFINIESMVSH